MANLVITNIDGGGSLTLRAPEPGDQESLTLAHIARPTIGGTFNTSELVGRPEVNGRHFEISIFSANGTGATCAAKLMANVDATITFFTNAVGRLVSVAFDDVTKTGIILNDSIEFIDMESYWTFGFDFQFNEVVT